MKITFLFLLLIIFSTQINGQEYTVQNFNDENGLPQNSVKTIAIDNLDFMWFATESGLVRYDGKHFVLFDKTQTKAKSNRFINLQRDPNTGKLYGNTEDWELVEIKNGKTIPKTTNYNSIFKFENSTNFTHLISWGTPSGVENYKRNLPYIILKEKRNNYKIFNQSISLYQQNKLINRINFKYKDQFRFFLLGNQLYYLNEDLVLFKHQDGKMISVKLDGDFTKILKKNNNRIFWNINSANVFIGVGDTLFELNKEGNNEIVKASKVIDHLNFEALGIRSIFSSANNNDIYIGTLTNGLFIYKKKLFNTLLPANNYESNVFYAQIPLKNNEVLFANGYLFNKSNSEKRFNFFDELSNRYSIAVDKNQNIWTSKTTRLYKISPDLKNIIKTYDFPSAVTMLNIAADDTVYSGNLKGVYYLKKNEDKFHLIEKLKSIEDVSHIQKSNNYLWVGTHKGLVYYDFKQDKVFSVKELINKDIRSVYIRNEEVWVTTYGDGYYLINNGKIVKLPNDKNNYLNAAHCILEDNNGFFWISTNKGLFKASISDLLAFTNKKTNSIYYSYYDRSAGFNTNEFNGGCQPCGSILNDGDFVFPTMNGVTMFNPLNLNSTNPDRPIFVEKITLDNIEIALKEDEINIPNNFNTLNILVTTPYFGNQENLNFEYKFANQTKWSTAKDQNISFSYLPTGKNTLNIRKVNGFGIDNYTYKNISLIVPIYYYENWWFILGVIFAVFVFIFCYIKLRTSRIRNRNIQLEKSIYESTLELQSTIKAYEFSKNRLDHQNYFQSRLIGAITHDIKSPLKYLMITGEALFKSKAKEVDKEGLKAIYSSSSQIYYFTDNLLQYAKGFTNKDLEEKQKFNLFELIENKIAIFEPIAKNQSSIITNFVAKEIIITSNKQLLSVIIHNILDNAVKFTYNGKINFDCIKVDNGHKIVIKDTGVGMKPYQVDWCNSEIDGLDQTKSIEKRPSPAGLGLIMVKELNKIIKSKLKVIAKEGLGTEFQITIYD